jgi:hypothetical protein
MRYVLRAPYLLRSASSPFRCASSSGSTYVAGGCFVPFVLSPSPFSRDGSGRVHLIGFLR